MSNQNKRTGFQNQGTPETAPFQEASNEFNQSQASTFQPAANYQQQVLSGQQPSAAGLAAAQQAGQLYTQNAGAATATRGGVGGANAARMAMGANAAGAQPIAAQGMAGAAQEKQGAASGLSNLGYMYGMNQLGAENAALKNKQAGMQEQQMLGEVNLNRRKLSDQEEIAAANAVGSMMGGAAMSDERAKEDIDYQGYEDPQANRAFAPQEHEQFAAGESRYQSLPQDDQNAHNYWRTQQGLPAEHFSPQDARDAAAYDANSQAIKDFYGTDRPDLYAAREENYFDNLPAAHETVSTDPRGVWGAATDMANNASAGGGGGTQPSTIQKWQPPSDASQPQPAAQQKPQDKKQLVEFHDPTHLTHYGFENVTSDVRAKHEILGDKTDYLSDFRKKRDVASMRDDNEPAGQSDYIWSDEQTKAAVTPDASAAMDAADKKIAGARAAAEAPQALRDVARMKRGVLADMAQYSPGQGPYSGQLLKPKHPGDGGSVGLYTADNGNTLQGLSYRNIGEVARGNDQDPAMALADKMEAARYGYDVSSAPTAIPPEHPWENKDPRTGNYTYDPEVMNDVGKTYQRFGPDEAQRQYDHWLQFQRSLGSGSGSTVTSDIHAKKEARPDLNGDYAGTGFGITSDKMAKDKIKKQGDSDSDGKTGGSSNTGDAGGKLQESAKKLAKPGDDSQKKPSDKSDAKYGISPGHATKTDPYGAKSAQVPWYTDMYKRQADVPEDRSSFGHPGMDMRMPKTQDYMSSSPFNIKSDEHAKADARAAGYSQAVRDVTDPHGAWAGAFGQQRADVVQDADGIRWERQQDGSYAAAPPPEVPPRGEVGAPSAYHSSFRPMPPTQHDSYQPPAASSAAGAGIAASKPSGLATAAPVSSRAMDYLRRKRGY